MSGDGEDDDDEGEVELTKAEPQIPFSVVVIVKGAKFFFRSKLGRCLPDRDEGEFSSVSTHNTR